MEEQSNIIQPSEESKLSVFINNNLFTSMHNPSGAEDAQIEKMVLTHPKIRKLLEGSEIRRIDRTPNSISIITDALDED